MNTINDISFEEWCVLLDKYYYSIGGIGGDLVAQTGTECWYDSFTEGLTPKEAFDDDLTYN